MADDFVNECGSCRHWVLNNIDRGGYALKGHCRRYPPSVVMDTPEHPYLNDGWPTVHAQSWCGEYSLRPGGVPYDVLRICAGEYET